MILLFCPCVHLTLECYINYWIKIKTKGAALDSKLSLSLSALPRENSKQRYDLFSYFNVIFYVGFLSWGGSDEFSSKDLSLVDLFVELGIFLTQFHLLADKNSTFLSNCWYISDPICQIKSIYLVDWLSLSCCGLKSLNFYTWL